MGTVQAQSGAYLLDAYPDARAAYSLRKLRSDYTGPAIRVRRSSDNAERDFGFSGDDLDIAAIESWLNGADGHVVRWYSQIPGHPPLLAFGRGDDLNNVGPLIAQAGQVLTNASGKPRLLFQETLNDGLVNQTPLPKPIVLNDMTITAVMEHDKGAGSLIAIAAPDTYHHYRFLIQSQGTLNHYWFNAASSAGSFDDVFRVPVGWDCNTITFVATPAGSQVFVNDEKLVDGTAVVEKHSEYYVQVGRASRGRGDGVRHYVSEVLVYPSTDESGLFGRYDKINPYWRTGPTGTNRQALLPQQYEYQVTLYDWLETISVQDVTLPTETLRWDGSVASMDALADLWLQVEGATASRVVRAEPEWYVLDAGNGKGIEATGTVRIWHGPGDGYSGNPPRSWSNEPAFLYQLNIPLAGGAQGNPYYKNRAMGLRALIVAVVDMMQYASEMSRGGFASWQDMYGKAFLGWAETYRWCKEELPPDVQDAFEAQMEPFLDEMIQSGPRAVNTNMDMFSLQGAADFYMATDNPVLKRKAVQAVKRALFGYPDGELGVKHDVFKTAGHNGGVFDPSGFIMEGDQPDIFYGGESIYHLVGALAAVTDPQTGTISSDWTFLEEVVRRLQLWRTYQYFYDPGVASPNVGGIKARHHYHAGAGFAGRTGAGVPSGQGGEAWMSMVLADYFKEARYKIRRGSGDASTLPSPSDMKESITAKLSSLTSELASVHEGEPPEWNGWSPWTKKTPYLPPKGWYSRLKKLIDAGDPTTYPPVARKGVYYNKAFGGYPVGNEYWAYKATDGEREWGFFVEAQARQGGYNGWYGGKIETFWTETTGVVLLNRHGKGGCDHKSEDSSCWDNLDYRAAHHVWGRDENGKGFTTLLLRGHELQRTSTFDLQAATPRVSVKNVFNDPSLTPSQSETGEQTGSELEGSVEITNTFEALTNGVRVTHTVTSNQTDQITELWASIPVFLRLYNPKRVGTDFQEDLDNTTIEYWTGTAWKAMPEDTNGDGTPEMVTTTKLRLGRDFKLGDGPQYVYVGFDGTQRVRLSTQIYYDPYQTKASVRTVHFDLHGNPGTVKTLPARTSISYAITTTDPAQAGKGGSGGGAVNQTISLKAGWNLVGAGVQVPAVDLEQVFSELKDRVAIVKDEQGRVFMPGFEVNTIGDWDPREAYQVYAREEVQIRLFGLPVASKNLSIPLKKGWNLLPYVKNQEMEIEDALASIRDRIVMVKDNLGNVYHPESNIDMIGTMRPGQGYKVYVTEDVSLVYP